MHSVENTLSAFVFKSALWNASESFDPISKLYLNLVTLKHIGNSGS